VIDDPPVPVELVMDLLDTSRIDEQRVSCMAAALREARQLVGRNQATGRHEKDMEDVSWSGALVYLIFAEQIGSCFHPIRPGVEPPEKGGL
jgi:hypothetical protein